MLDVVPYGGVHSYSYSYSYSTPRVVLYTEHVKYSWNTVYFKVQYSTRYPVQLYTVVISLGKETKEAVISLCVIMCPEMAGLR